MNNNRYFEVKGEDVLAHLDDLLVVTPESTHFANRLLYYMLSDYIDKYPLISSIPLCVDLDYEMNLDVVYTFITTLKRDNPHLRLSLIESLFLSYKYIL